LRILKCAVGYLLNIVFGVGAYFVFTKLSLAITGQELTKTKGIDTMGQFDFSRISSIIQIIIKNTYDIFTGNDLEISYNYATKLMYLVLTLCVVYYLIRLIIRQLKGKEYFKFVLTIVLIIAYEIAINGIFIMCEDGIYVLMYYSYVFLMIFPICIIEHCITWKPSRISRILEYCVVFALVIGIASYCHFANAQYLVLELSYEQAQSYCTTLVTQIKSVDGYSDELPVVFVGQEISDETLYRNDVVERLMFSGREETLVEAYSREYMLRYYCGFDPIYLSSEDILADAIEQMPTYPKDGSIKVIDGTVVVRFE
jgi:hypothetical protein